MKSLHVFSITVLQVVKVPETVKILFIMRMANIAGPMPQKVRKILQVICDEFCNGSNVHSRKLKKKCCQIFTIFSLCNNVKRVLPYAFLAGFVLRFNNERRGYCNIFPFSALETYRDEQCGFGSTFREHD